MQSGTQLYEPLGTGRFELYRSYIGTARIPVQVF